MKLTPLICILTCFTISYTMEKKPSNKHSITDYRYLLSNLLEKSDEEIFSEFPCDPHIPKKIRENLRITPGWENGNQFEWLPGYIIRECGTSHLIGAAIIRKCARDLKLNLVSAPDRRLAFVYNQEQVEAEVANYKTEVRIYDGMIIDCDEDNCVCYKCWDLRILKRKLKQKAAHRYIVDKKVTTIKRPLNLTQVQQLCMLFNNTGYKINHPDDVLHGTDGIVYLTDTCFIHFSQEQDKLRFELDVYSAMNRLKKVPLQPVALYWLEQQIAQKFEQLKTAGIKFHNLD